MADRSAVSWFSTVEAGVGLYELGFLVGGEGTEVDVHCVPTLGCGVLSLVVSSTLLISELSSNLEVLFEGLPFGVISLGGVVKLRGLPLSMLFLGGLGPLFEVPGDCWVIIVAVNDGLDESLVESFFKDLQDAVLINRNLGEVDKSFELRDVLVETVHLFQLLEVNVRVILILVLVNASLKSFLRLTQRSWFVLSTGGTLVTVLSNKRLSWSSFQPSVWSPSRYIRKV